MRFRADNLRVEPREATAGETIRIEAQVTNLLTEQTEYNGVLWINDQVQSSRSVMIDGNATETIVLNVQLESGTYTVRVDRLLDRLAVKPAGPTADSLCQFDTDGNEAIERPEAVEAATNYLLGRGSIIRNDAVAVVTAYLLEQRFTCR